MVTDYPPKAFAKCDSKECSHHEVWLIKKQKIPKKFTCPECGWRNILEQDQEISHCLGMTTEIKVVTSMDPRFDD